MLPPTSIIAEGGLLLGVPIAALLAFIAREVWKRLRGSRVEDRAVRIVRVGAMTALVAVGLQTSVDFSLQMPGNAALFCIACALAMHVPVTPLDNSRLLRSRS